MEHDEMVSKIITLEGSMKTIYNRVDGVDIEIKEIKSDNKILHEMNKNIAVLATNYEYQGKKIDSIETDLKDLKSRPIPDITELESDVKDLKKRPIPDITELKNDVKGLKEKPGKRWDTLTTLIFSLIVSGIVGFILGKVLGG